MPKTLITAASLPSPPDLLFDMYLDPNDHSAFTGLPVTIGARPGDPFRGFDGAIWGSMLHVEAKRLIVQTWRSVNFPPAAIDSILILTFWPQGEGGRIESHASQRGRRRLRRRESRLGEVLLDIVAKLPGGACADVIERENHPTSYCVVFTAAIFWPFRPPESWPRWSSGAPARGAEEFNSSVSKRHRMGFSQKPLVGWNVRENGRVNENRAPRLKGKTSPIPSVVSASPPTIASDPSVITACLSRHSLQGERLSLPRLP